MPNFGYDEVWAALEESVKLQSHYAGILNDYDGGMRMSFKDAKEWLERLRKMANQNDRDSRNPRRV